MTPDSGDDEDDCATVISGCGMGDLITGQASDGWNSDENNDDEEFERDEDDDDDDEEDEDDLEDSSDMSNDEDVRY